MNMLENFFLNLNFSWFSSRFSAYMVIQLISIVVFYIIRKKNHFKRKFFKLALYSFILLTPTLTYFYFYPIFKGDVLNLGEKPRTKILFSEKKKVVVFVLPCRLVSAFSSTGIFRYRAF